MSLILTIIPGLGHLYNGRIFQGLLWFVFTGIGYACFVVPGLALHLICFFDAGRDAKRQDAKKMARQAEIMAAAISRRQ